MGGAPTSATSAPTTASSSGTTETPSPTSSESPSPSSSTSSAPAAQDYAAGQCLGPKPGYAKVDCSTSHLYEVAAAPATTLYAGDLVKRTAYGTAVCNEQGAKYLGSAGWAVSRLQVATLPTAADPKNKERFVCIVQEFENSLKSLKQGTGSVKGKLTGSGFYSYNLCLKGRASKSDDVEFVPCNAPHASEATGGKLNGRPGAPFPGGDKIQKQALSYCKPIGEKFLGTKRRTDIISSQNSGGPGPWAKGQMFTGCFVEVTSGTVKKSLHYITTKPLTSYR
ncbi:hypothetical protein VV02_19095 [Luteipulveratus mongoliensis]|uniref:Septum formation-related domain-containing protein n=1 Tax=Luteipulveratus mongoliensis TaxID=571913 RepID=A0A0K1JLK4_9MICO|nr:hypothetical protein VV02_19095 [Luteipulveratus mongoliensis]